MKHYISVVFVALAVILASQSAFALRKCEVNHTVCADIGGSQKNRNGGYDKFPVLANWKPFLPSDSMYTEIGHRGKRCDFNGNFVDNNKLPWCHSIQSPSSGVHYRILRSGKEGDRIFKMENNKPTLLVQLDGGSSYEGSSNHIIFASPEALQFAENNGYVLDKRNNTMVAKGSLKDNTEVSEPTPTDNPAPTQATNVVDCASKTALLEKMKCIADNAAAQNK